MAVPMPPVTPGWRDRAACTGLDADIFDPDTGRTAEALPVCAACPVRLSCYSAAYDKPADRTTVRAGTTPHTRPAKAADHISTCRCGLPTKRTAPALCAACQPDPHTAEQIGAAHARAA